MTLTARLLAAANNPNHSPNVRQMLSEAAERIDTLERSAKALESEIVWHERQAHR